MGKYILEALEELNKIEEDYLIEMANIVGKYVKIENLKFSFYFSSKDGVSHSIRVKPVFNTEKLLKSKTGTLQLTGNWEYIPGEDDKSVSGIDINNMKSFFKEYIVLFCMVWDEQLDDTSVQRYFNGDMSFEDLLKEISFYDEVEMNSITTVEELTDYARKTGFVNFYGN